MKRSVSGVFLFTVVVALFTLFYKPLPDAYGQTKPTPTPIEKGQTSSASGNVVVPDHIPFDDSLIDQLKVPTGFKVNVFAKDLSNVRMMAVSADGVVYVTRREQGDVMMLRDTNNDGQADENKIIADNIERVHGITIHDGKLYLIDTRRLYVSTIQPDGTINTPQMLIDDLPDGGQHDNRTLAFGPDNMLYISVGSTCNACRESNPENATILKVNPDTWGREIVARGLRNAEGFGWHPETGELWAMDMGTDWRGDEIPPEELNLIQATQNYGWPFCFGNKQVDQNFAQNPEGQSKEQYCAETTAPVLTYEAHAATVHMVFYTAAQFPKEYLNHAFVSSRGSWNRAPAVGYKVLRLVFENGKPVRFEDFLTGFLAPDGKSFFARPTGLAVHPDGSLLLTDDTNGVIYRIAYTAND